MARGCYGTLHEAAAQALLEKFLETEAGIRNLAEGKRWLQEWPGDDDEGQGYLDCIGQYHGKDPGKTDPAQIASLVTIHHRIMSPGVTARARIGMGEGPYPDARRQENAAILAEVPEPFVAEVYRHQDDPARGDGVLRWTEPIRTIVSTGLTLVTSCRREKIPVVWMAHAQPPGQIPLEIGYTKASKTLYHLLHDGGVARWAYDQEEIEVWITLRRPILDVDL